MRQFDLIKYLGVHVTRWADGLYTEGRDVLHLRYYGHDFEVPLHVVHAIDARVREQFTYFKFSRIYTDDKGEQWLSVLNEDAHEAACMVAYPMAFREIVGKQQVDWGDLPFDMMHMIPVVRHRNYLQGKICRSTPGGALMAPTPKKSKGLFTRLRAAVTGLRSHFTKPGKKATRPRK